MATRTLDLGIPDSPHINVVATGVLLGSLIVGGLASLAVRNPVPLVVMAVAGVIAMQSPKIAKQWERAIVLRLGRFIGLQGPGLFWILPFVDTVSSWIDQRTITTSFAAEQTLTSDTVPVNVDAVLFWMRDEHALRRAERKGRADAHSEQCRRVDGHGRPDGRRGFTAAETDRRRRSDGQVRGVSRVGDQDTRSSGAACLDNAEHRGCDPLHRRLVSMGHVGFRL